MYYRFVIIQLLHSRYGTVVDRRHVHFQSLNEPVIQKLAEAKGHVTDHQLKPNHRSRTDTISSYIPQMPRAVATLLFGLDVSSYNILAKVSEYLLSVKSISAKAFS